MSPAEQRRVAAVSVVVPVYNVRPHLEACLRSVLDQSLKELELIVVDDASTDDTHAVIAALADADERVRPVRLDAHGGASRARNFGLAEARGEYLLFLDGDDRWPNPGMLEELVAAARLNAADLTEFGFHRDDRSDPEWTQSPPPRRVTLSSSDPASLRYNVWARLIRRSLVTAHGLRFSEDLDIGEDALFSIGLYAVAEVVQQVDTPYYFYRNNPQGVTNARWDWNKLRSASSWFGTALEAIAATPHTERVAWMRRAVILERFMMLSRRLGVLAAHELDDRQLPEFMRLWSEPMAAAPTDCFRRTYPRRPDGAALDRLLAAVRSGDPQTFRVEIADHAKLARRSVTLTREQAEALAGHLTATEDDPVQVRFVSGQVLRLPRRDARQLAATLTSNTEARITLMLPEGVEDERS